MNGNKPSLFLGLAFLLLFVGALLFRPLLYVFIAIFIIMALLLFLYVSMQSGGGQSPYKPRASSTGSLPSLMKPGPSQQRGVNNELPPKTSAASDNQTILIVIIAIVGFIWIAVAG